MKQGGIFNEVIENKRKYQTETTELKNTTIELKNSTEGFKNRSTWKKVSVNSKT